MTQRISNLANSFLDNMGALFLLFGVALVTIGASVRVSREYQVAQVESQNVVPTFAPAAMFAAPVATLVPMATARPVPDRIEIPAIGLDCPVEEVGWEATIVNGESFSSWQTASFAAGWHKNSKPPGEIGNTVISGHNNIDGAVFKDIHLLDFDDRIYVHVGSQVHVYGVSTNFVVREAGAEPEARKKNARWISRTEDERLTMVTCFPPWSNTHRTIVIARPLEVRSSAGDTLAGVD